MADILSIPGAEVLIRLIMVVLFGGLIFSGTKEFLEELKNKGFKKSIDELLIVLLWACVGIFVFKNLDVIANILDIIFDFIITLFENVVNWLTGG